MAAEVFVIPAFGQGHLFPSLELCNLIASRNFKATLIIFSSLSSSIPSTFLNHPLIDVVCVPSPPGSDPAPMHPDSRNQMRHCLETLLSARPESADGPPVCAAIVDVLVVYSWAADVLASFGVPAIGFFTSGACSAAMEYAMWKASAGDVMPGEVRLLPGLPEEMGITVMDLKRRSEGNRHGGPPAGTESGKRRRKMPPGPGDQPPWVDDTEGSVALMINTCDDLERPFIDYLALEVKKPVWGVGPLFPDHYWRASTGSLIHDSEIRTIRSTDVSEDRVIQWLDSKPRGSVLYVSFGSSVDLTKEDYPQLADALESSTHPFIWVIRKNAGRVGPPNVGPEPNSEDLEGYYPHGLDTRVGNRGLIIHGWAPQLLILSHPSTGGFLSHCGWNSTMEAMCRGVPMLAWPLRGDQYYDAKLVVNHLKIGYNVCDDWSQKVRKDDILKGIEKLMGDKEMKKIAEAIGAKFHCGFPTTSLAALDAFCELIRQNAAHSA